MREKYGPVAQMAERPAQLGAEWRWFEPTSAQLFMRATYSYSLLVIIVAGCTTPSIRNRVAPQTRVRVEFIGFT